MENKLKVTVSGADLVPQQARMVIPTIDKGMYLAEVINISESLYQIKKTWKDIYSLDYIVGMRAPYHLNNGKGYPDNPGTTVDGYEIEIKLR